MSALNVTQEEADLLMVSLKMYADVHQNASGVVPEDVAVLLAKLAPVPTSVVEVPADVVEPTVEEVEAHFAAEKAEETPAEEASAAE